MGIFSAFARFFRTLFGLAEGGTQRATDNLLTSSPDAIRNQFRKTREDWIHDYEDMKSAVADLIAIRDERASQLSKMHKTLDEISVKMAGAIELFKKNQDEHLRTTYGDLAEKKTELEHAIDALNSQVVQQEQVIEQYKARLRDLQANIDNLKNEEAETVADIVSTRKITELNNKLQGLSTDTQTKNLEAIREARTKAKSIAQLSSSLSGRDVIKVEQQLLSAGASSKHLSEFDEAVKLDKLLIAPVTQPSSIPVSDTKEVKSLDKLFQ